MRVPRVGDLIRFAYLWVEQAARGKTEGLKDRPCAVVVSAIDDTGATRLLVLPVTHSSPSPGDLTVELPTETKRRLGLDAERSWIVTDEYKDFIWPGSDVRPDASGEAIIGALPQSIIVRATANLRTHALAGRATRAVRD